MACNRLNLWLGRCRSLLLSRSLGSNLCLISLDLNTCEVWLRHEWEQLEQELLLLVLCQLHATRLREFRVWLVLILRDVVVALLAYATNLEAELRINLHRGSAILTLHEAHELIVLCGVHLTTCLQIESAVHSLSTYNLRCRGYEWRKTRREAHLRDQLHSLRQDILSLESLQLCHHIRVHTARNLCLLNELVRCREAEVSLDLLCCIEQGVEVILLCRCNCAIELCLNLRRGSVNKWVEWLWCRLVLAEYRDIQLRADILQLLVDLCYSLHIHAQVDAELLAEEVDELQCRSTCTTTKPPTVSIHNIYTCYDSSVYRCKTITRGTVCVEIHRDACRSLELLDKCTHALWRNQARHILDGDHIGTECSQLLRLSHKVVVGEDRRRILLAHQLLEERQLRILRVYGVAYCAVGNTTILLYILDGRLHVLDIVQAVEDTHNTQTALDGVAAEALDNLVGVWRITEEVTATRKCCELRNITHLLLDALETIPRILTEITHYRIRHCTAPHLHCEEVCILVVGQTTLHLSLCHTGCKRRLLTVAQSQISDFKSLSHS